MIKSTKLLVVLWLLLISIASVAQISEEGSPPSFKFQTSTLKSSKVVKPFIAQIDFDVEALKQEDNLALTMGKPLRVSSIIPVRLDMNECGEWTTLPDGQTIWQLEIHAPGAIATSLLYEKFVIPEGDQLYIYSKTHKHLLGAYTYKTNRLKKEFATEFLAGDQFILEYVPAKTPEIVQKTQSSQAQLINAIKPESGLKSANAEKAEIVISGIQYGYNHIRVQESDGLGASGECHVDINCPEGADWQDQKKGVYKTITPIGQYGYYCTGTIINNTSQDLTPLALTANHCIEVNGTLANAGELRQQIYYFHYEKDECKADEIDISDSKVKTFTGAFLLTRNELHKGADGALLQLATDIPQDYNIYYNGWTLKNEAPKHGVGIHHPAGDVKKISTYDEPAVSTEIIIGKEMGVSDGYWNVKWVSTQTGWGVTEQGSSGSPLFNEDGLVVGTLTGGPQMQGVHSCDMDEKNKVSIYGKLWYHFDQSPDPNNHMKAFLDPENTNIKTVPGTYTGKDVVVGFTADNTLVYIPNTVTFSSESFNADTHKWSFPGGTPSSSEEKTVTVTYNEPGTYSVSLTINEGQGSDREKTLTKENYIQIAQIEGEKEESQIIGSGKEESNFPLGNTHLNTYSSSIYTQEELGVKKTITHLAWEAAYAVSTTRKVEVYLKEVNESEQVSSNFDDEIQDATLVFASPNTWANLGGWNMIRLHSPFAYSGEKNLKVIVKTVTANITNTAGVYCTNASNKHQTWENDIPFASVGAGTVGSLRPNIRILSTETVTAVKPEANFAIAKDIYFEENFDDSEKVNTLWNVYTPGAENSDWVLANINGDLFNEVDPDNYTSMLVAPNLEGIIDTRLILKEAVSVPAGAKLEFYEYHDGFYGEGTLSLSVSEDDGNSWDPVFLIGGVEDPNYSGKWSRVRMDFSPYANKSIKLMFRYYGTGNVAGIDGVKLYIPSVDEQIELFVGEKLDVQNLTVGPPSQYVWEFEGGTPEKSNLADPGPIVYYTPRNEPYKISLYVQNHLGEDSKRMEKAVIIKERAPVAQIKAEGGYNTYPNHTRHIAEGSSLNFTDASLNFPTSFNWTFEGGSPATSTNKAETVSYALEGEYDVTSVVTNGVGTDQKTFSKYVKVGGSAEIWNMPKGIVGDYANPLEENAYLPGTNETLFTAFGEKFTKPEAVGEIKSVKIRFHKDTNSNEEITVAVFDSEYGLPKSVITSTKLNVNDIISDEYTEVVFEQPAPITDEFFIVVTPPKEAVVAICINEEDISNGSMYIFIDFMGMFGFWISAAEQVNLIASMNIVPTFTFSRLEIASEDHYSVQDIQQTEQNIDIKANISWEVESSPWINIINKTDNSISFKAKTNLFDFRTGYIKVHGGGLSKTITVDQSAARPIKVSATYDGDKTAEVKWSELYDNTEDFYDDIEQHDAFKINSSGEVGWSFIDEDKYPTFSIEGLDFINTGKPMSFIVLNRDELKVNDEYRDSFNAHSGKQYFASFGTINGVRNDWIVSPRLNYEGEFTFSFYARSYTHEYGPDRFNVYYSTDVLDGFVKVNEAECLEANLEWTLYEFTIPAGAQFVAINCISAESVLFMVDDLYIGQGESPTKAAPQSANQQLGSIMPTKKAIQKTISAYVSDKYELASIDMSALSPKEKEILEMALEGKKEQKVAFNLRDNEDHVNITPQALRPTKPLSPGLQWHNNVKFLSIAPIDGFKFEAAIAFDADDLLPYLGFTLDFVEFHIGSIASFNLKIYINNELKVTQPVKDVNANSFNMIPLDESITIDESIQTLILSFEIFDYAEGAGVATFDRGPRQPDSKGDLFGLNDQWFTLLDAMGGEAPSGNWLITAILNGTSKEIELTYNVYHEGEKVGSTDELFFNHTDLPGGETCFTVTATQKGVTEIESSPSEKACIESKYPLIVQANTVEKYVGEEHPDVTDEYTIQGFIDSDNVTYLSKKPIASIDPIFKTHIGIGSYKDAILVSGAEDDSNKYRFEYKYGSLIVKDHPTSIEGINGNNVLVYPTLTTGIIHINLVEKDTEVQIFDFLGRLLLNEKLSVGDNTLDISKFNKGVYYVKVDASTTKIIKQ